jgi:hypothetical protein
MSLCVTEFLFNLTVCAMLCITIRNHMLVGCVAIRKSEQSTSSYLFVADDFDLHEMNYILPL